MVAMEFRFITTQDPDYDGERDLRSSLLREPLGFPPGAEIFSFEDESLHLIAREGGRVVGCLLFHPEGEGGRIYQVAVGKKFQKTGLGSGLMKAMEERLSKDGFKNVYVNARHYTVGFFERLGYKKDGEKFTEVGIDHFKMSRKLSE